MEKQWCWTQIEGRPEHGDATSVFWPDGRKRQFWQSAEEQHAARFRAEGAAAQSWRADTSRSGRARRWYTNRGNSFSFTSKRLDSTGKPPLPGAPSNAAERQQHQGSKRPKTHKIMATPDTRVGTALADVDAPQTLIRGRRCIKQPQRSSSGSCRLPRWSFSARPPRDI
jgi:hypothetical protein